MTEKNPWGEIGESTRRRAVIDDDIFWIKDGAGNYGIYIEFPMDTVDVTNTLKLHNIEIVKKFSEKGKMFQWYLVLRNKDQWPIFKVLCLDLIHAATLSNEPENKIKLIENRLKLWQELLKNKSSLTLSVEKQMGLYTELHFLRNILFEKLNSNVAIKSWYGPEQDKQDFVLENSSYEIKSYRTSKGEKVFISSKEQLSSTKENEYLIAYGLTIKEQKDNIYTLSKDIENFLVRNNSLELVDLFYMKLFHAGYSPKLYSEEFLSNFKVDCITFYRIEGDFPRIVAEDIAPQIVSLSYQIDLSQCKNWRLNSADIIFKGEL